MSQSTHLRCRNVQLHYLSPQIKRLIRRASYVFAAEAQSFKIQCKNLFSLIKTVKQMKKTQGENEDGCYEGMGQDTILKVWINLHLLLLSSPFLLLLFFMFVWFILKDKNVFSLPALVRLTFLYSLYTEWSYNCHMKTRPCEGAALLLERGDPAAFLLLRDVHTGVCYTIDPRPTGLNDIIWAIAIDQIPRQIKSRTWFPVLMVLALCAAQGRGGLMLYAWIYLLPRIVSQAS